MKPQAVIDDAILKGREEFKKFYSRHQQERSGPEMDTLIKVVLKMIPPEVMAELERQSPQAVRDVRKRFGGE